MSMVGYAPGIGRTYTDQDVDNMWESDAARQWEAMNEDDPYAGNLIEASKTLKVAENHLNGAIDSLLGAIDEVYDIPEVRDTLNDCYEEMISLRGFIDRMRDRYGRGVR